MMRHGCWAYLLVFFVGAAAWWPDAAQGDEAPPLIREWLPGLGQDDFATRQEATRRLLSEPLDLAILQALYAAATLPEQRHRLLTVARHHVLGQVRQERFKGAGRGAIGIQHQSFSASKQDGLDQPGLLVAKTFPGFPGHVSLEAGDLIVGIDGKAFAPDLSAAVATNQFIKEIQRRQAGDTVRLDIYRDGHKASVAVQLASLSALQAMYRNAGQLQQPFLDAWIAQKRKIVGQPEHGAASVEEIETNTAKQAQPHAP